MLVRVRSICHVAFRGCCAEPLASGGVFALLTPSLQSAEFHVSSPLSLSGPGLFASPEGFATSRTEALRDRGGVGGIDQRKHQPSDRGNKLQPVKCVDST